MNEKSELDIWILNSSAKEEGICCKKTHNTKGIETQANIDDPSILLLCKKAGENLDFSKSLAERSNFFDEMIPFSWSH